MFRMCVDDVQTVWCRTTCRKESVEDMMSICPMTRTMGSSRTAADDWPAASVNSQMGNSASPTSASTHTAPAGTSGSAGGGETTSVTRQVSSNCHSASTLWGTLPGSAFTPTTCLVGTSGSSVRPRWRSAAAAETCLGRDQGPWTTPTSEMMWFSTLGWCLSHYNIKSATMSPWNSTSMISGSWLAKYSSNPVNGIASSEL